MSDTNISKTTISDFKNRFPDYEVESIQTEGAQDQEETEYSWSRWPLWYGYYRKIPELKKAIDAFATWSVGKGYDTDIRTEKLLSYITGWGEDTFQSILWNLIVVKKINGDSFAEVIRDEDGDLINLKPLDPGSMKVIVNRKGIIKRYEQTSKIGKEGRIVDSYQPNQILHLVNERVADEIHGISVIEACEDTILRNNEAKDDWRTVLHRNVHPVKIWHLDTDDQSKIDAFRIKVENVVRDKENIFIPKGNVDVEIPAVNINSTLNPLPWIQYNEDFFYKAVGIPKVIVGGSQEFTEATAKIAYLTFAQVYAREQRELEADLWNQLGIRIKIVQPVSIHNELLTDEKKDKGTGGAIEPEDLNVNMAQD